MGNGVDPDELVTAGLDLHYVKKRKVFHFYQPSSTGPRSAVGNVSGYRCVSDCNSKGRELDPGPVPYFRGD